MRAGVNNTTLCHCVIKRGSESRLPHFVRNRDIPIANSLIYSLGIGGHILYIISHAFENATDHIGHNDLT